MSLKNWIKFCAVGLIWGSTFLWIKIAIREVGPYTLVAYRIFFSILALAPYAFRPQNRPAWRIVLPAVFLGLFNLVIPQTLISWGEQYIPSWLASILVSAVPFFTAMLALPFFVEERLTAKKALGMALGFLGVVVLVGGQINNGATFNVLGALAVLGAALCFSISNVFSRARANHIQPEGLSFWMMIPAVLIILPVAIATETPFVIPKLPLTWIALIWMGALNGGIAMIFFYSLIQSVGPGRTSLVAYTYPLVGVLLGIIFLRETPGWQLGFGGLLILAGIVVFNWKNKRI